MGRAPKVWGWAFPNGAAAWAARPEMESSPIPGLQQLQPHGHQRHQGRGWGHTGTRQGTGTEEGRYLAVGGQPGVVERSLQQPHQQVLHGAGAAAHPQQPLLQRAQAGHVPAGVESQHLAVALQELQHRQAVGEGAAGQHQAWDAREGGQRLRGEAGRSGQGVRAQTRRTPSPSQPGGLPGTYPPSASSSPPGSAAAVAAPPGAAGPAALCPPCAALCPSSPWAAPSLCPSPLCPSSPWPGDRPRGGGVGGWSLQPPPSLPHGCCGPTLDFFLASFALGAFASCFCLFLAWGGTTRAAHGLTATRVPIGQVRGLLCAPPLRGRPHVSHQDGVLPGLPPALPKHPSYLPPHFLLDFAHLQLVLIAEHLCGNGRGGW